MLYLDTSVLIAALVNENQTTSVHSWLLKQPPDDLTVSEWTVTEFSSALAIRRRTGQLSDSTSRRAAGSFAVLTKEMLEVLPVVQQDFRDAARLIDDSSEGLRAGEALHLAIALRTTATMCTLDRLLLRAAQAAGAPTDAVLS